jgi:anionic cell wall polymer biosynthesis LytR-Cps2A-Psr (LCP) family protein
MPSSSSTTASRFSGFKKTASDAYDLVRPDWSPGTDLLWGTDDGGNRKWRSDAEVVAHVAPNTKQILVASDTWTWVHGLGFKPIIDVYDDTFSQIIAAVDHTDNNTVVVSHASSLTGWIFAR